MKKLLDFNSRFSVKENSGKKKVLKRINNALFSNDLNMSLIEDTAVYRDRKDDISIIFAENFSKANGKLIYCSDEEDFKEKIKALIEDRNWGEIVCYNQNLCDYLLGNDVKSTLFEHEKRPAIGVSLCENLVARTGSIVISSMQGIGKRLAQFPETLVIIAFTSQVVNDLQSSFRKMLIRYKQSLPKTILTLTPTEILFKEINEFYIFLIEDMEF